jgi:hypothetical protein
MALKLKEENYIAVDSGNGSHLYIACDAMQKTGIDRFVNSIKILFETDSVEVDTTVTNPSRVMRAPGSYNNKGGINRRCDYMHVPEVVMSLDYDFFRHWFAFFGYSGSSVFPHHFHELFRSRKDQSTCRTGLDACWGLQVFTQVTFHRYPGIGLAAYDPIRAYHSTHPAAHAPLYITIYYASDRIPAHSTSPADCHAWCILTVSADHGYLMAPGLLYI